MIYFFLWLMHSKLMEFLTNWQLNKPGPEGVVGPIVTEGVFDLTGTEGVVDLTGTEGVVDLTGTEGAVDLTGTDRSYWSNRY